LHQELGVQTREELHRAAEQGHIREVHGFGPKTQQQILEAAVARLQGAHRFKLAMAAAASTA
jgi:DNA polymerase (family 10)